MQLLVINPNTTQSMTDKIGETARAVAARGTEVIALSPADGPVSIEGSYDEAFCVPGLIDETIKGVRESADAVVVACFDDPGIDACREAVDVPVIGICHAAMVMASLASHGFSVVTTLNRSVPIVEALAVKYGMERQCRSVRAAEVPVLALEDPASDAADKVRAEVKRALAEDRAEAVILGCAGMTDLAAALSAETGAPVIDGVAAAVKLAEAAVGFGLKTSKIGGYARPRAKTSDGAFARFAPGGDR